MKKPTIILLLDDWVKPALKEKLKTYNVSYRSASCINEVKAFNGKTDVILLVEPPIYLLHKHKIPFLILKGDADYIFRVIFEQLGWSNPF